MDFDAKDLACWAEIREVVFFPEPGLDFESNFGRFFPVQHSDVVDVQKHENTIAAEIEVGVGQGLFEHER